MSTPVIRVENLGKRYDIGANSADTLRDQLANMARRLTGHERQAEARNEIWALKDINLEVQQGEVLGIIGHNGAGKSTLLKILSRITHPTTGRIALRGRVASLLEVGTGFHPELTGRENIFMNAAVLGMKRSETKKKFDEIVDFAGVEQFIDTPVKRYSSGMYTRLAFSVAAHLEPEILIVDEVLSVGDAAFQKKSLGKMEEVSGQGRTVLFVSHNMASIRNMCNRVILLNSGGIRKEGPADAVVKEYLSLQPDSSIDDNATDVRIAPQPELPMHIDRVRLLDENSAPIPKMHTLSSQFCIELTYTVREPHETAYLLCHFNDAMGQIVLFTYDAETEQFGNREVGTFITRVCIPERILTDGNYTLHAAIVDVDHAVIQNLGIVTRLEIKDTTSFLARRNVRWPAVTGFNPEWKTEKVK